MMKCSRCGTGCPTRDNGLCLHCHIATDLEASLGVSLKDAGVDEGFPDWEELGPNDKPRQEMLL